MYVPTIFNPPSAIAVKSYIDENGFATLVGLKSGGIIATHTPLFLKEKEGKEYLIGHISIANEQKSCFEEGQEMLAIFMENHTYISSSWYDHINVPTWNYIAVHIYGRVKKLPEDEKLKVVDNLVARYEEKSKEPFHTSQMSDNYLKNQLKGIVAFEMEIQNIEASWKLSQNRDNNNYLAIINKLKERGDEMSLMIAKEMEALR